ncbi:MAG TPA: hypothetical protein VLE70_00955 [Anaerolineae bacterium]|jgi:hypothetical protein|nr:hypothetical protein [Anaerolineae bacterium]
MSEEPQYWSDRILSQGQGDRFDRWVEFLGALVLAAATVATAWTAYQATLWGGDESKFYFEASAAQVDAAQFKSLAMQRASLHAGLFVEYAAARSAGDQELANFLYQRFPPELKEATDAWLATDPLNDPNAPPSPFDMPEYRLPEQDAAEQNDQLAKSKFTDAAEADEYADKYVLLTVIFATVLFFSGIAGKFQWRVIDGAVLGMGILALAIGLVMLTQMPVQ